MMRACRWRPNLKAFSGRWRFPAPRPLSEIVTPGPPLRGCWGGPAAPCWRLAPTGYTRMNATPGAKIASGAVRRSGNGLAVRVCVGRWPQPRSRDLGPPRLNLICGFQLYIPARQAGMNKDPRRPGRGGRVTGVLMVTVDTVVTGNPDPGDRRNGPAHHRPRLTVPDAGTASPPSLGTGVRDCCAATLSSSPTFLPGRAGIHHPPATGCDLFNSGGHSWGRHRHAAGPVAGQA